MKQKSMLITLIVCTLIVCIFFLVFFIKNYEQKNLPEDISISKTTYETGFILGQYEGKLATFKVNSSTPIEVFDVYISSLPSNDKEELEKGIYVKNEDELQSLIEDYTS